MSETATVAPPSKPRSRRRWPRYVVAGLVLFGSALLAIYLYAEHAARERLARAQAMVDRLEPDGWRFHEMWPRRPPLPDDQNLTLQVGAIARRLPGYLVSPDMGTELSNVPTQRRLTPKQTAAVRESLDKLKAELAEARMLRTLKPGRSSKEWPEDWFNVVSDDASKTRQVASLLSYDVTLAAQEGRPDDAVRSCEAILAAGHAIEEQPSLIGLLVRIAVRTVAIRRLERALAQGEPSTGVLEEVQRLLEQEEAEPGALAALRGERALHDRWFEGMQAGRVKTPVLYAPTRWGSFRIGGTTLDAILARFRVGNLANARAAMLEWMTELVEAAKLPEAEQSARFAELAASVDGRHHLIKLMAPTIDRVILNAWKRDRATLRALIVAVAAERYRRERQAWPARIEELVPKYLTAVPRDPYDGKPLRLARKADGIVIYAVGQDLRDNGGDLEMTGMMPGKDVGIQLWDVSRRRQPPLPEKPSGEADPGPAP